jgi:hypothetical protein
MDMSSNGPTARRAQTEFSCGHFGTLVVYRQITTCPQGHDAIFALQFLQIDVVVTITFGGRATVRKLNNDEPKQCRGA